VADAPLAPVVSAAWLEAHRDAVVVADVRWYLDGRSGRAAYDDGHIPGAVFVDLDVALADPPAPERGRHPLPDPERFAAELAALGIGDGATVVAYDDAGGSIAARLVWLLRITGTRAALLDGGLAAWSGALETEPALPDAAPRTPVAWPAELLADADAVAATPATVLDARAPERFRGEVEAIDPRAGHVPGAGNAPWTGSLDAGGRFLEPAALRARFAALGIDSDGPERPIAYCGSGVTACHVLVALEVAGLGVGRLYPGSWSQWSSDPERPIATGP
jgi:thiosulfate/3-mercaptopyruvate sulfurtransferase